MWPFLVILSTRSSPVHKERIVTSTRRKRSNAHLSRGRATTFGASLMAAVDDRTTGVSSIVPTCRHSSQRGSPSRKRSGGKRRLQFEHRGHPMLGDFNNRRGRSASPITSGNQNELGRLPPAAGQLRGAADRVLAVVGGRVPNFEPWSSRPLAAEQISFGQGPPFLEPLIFGRSKCRHSFSQLGCGADQLRRWCKRRVRFRRCESGAGSTVGSR